MHKSSASRSLDPNKFSFYTHRQMDVRPLRIAIIDDDVWVARGRAAAINESSELISVGTWLPGEALARTDPSQWADIDVVVVDAHDGSADFDKFVGVGVVSHIRSVTTASHPRIVVITGHVFNDLLRVRMKEAGADFLYAHSDVRSPEQLIEVILTPAPTASVQGASTSPADGVNAAVAWAATHLGEDALRQESQKALPLSRRSIITARHRLRRHMPSAGDHNPPSWKEVTGFVDRARGKERRG
jgi:CheY-like chemotaxis protein